MKTKLLFFLALFFTIQVSISQTVAIPDANFEQALIDLGIDTNGLNGNILQSEAEAVINLNISNKNIASLQGVEAFTNLSTLNSSSNQLTNIDVSNNLALIELTVNNNQIENLNLSNNILLKRLYCNGNKLTDLNVSSNTFLTQIGFRLNELESVNVKNGNNQNFTLFKGDLNPNLTCIEVDDRTYSNSNWTDIDAQTIFSESCGEGTVIIPDANFEQALIDLGIDTNGLNGNMHQSEAEAVINLNISNKNIASLQGVEAFTNLSALNSSSNQLTNIDVSNNLALIELTVNNNQIENLNLSNNILLKRLYCNGNKLTDLNVSSNTFLTQIGFRLNELESVNVKNGNNQNFTLFKGDLNPNLKCIEVDDVTYSEDNWTDIDEHTSFSEDCSATLTIKDVDVLANVKLYPNPASSNFSIKGLQEDSTIKVYDINSKLIISQSINNNEAIDISNVPSGLYFINIPNNTGSTVKS